MVSILTVEERKFEALAVMDDRATRLGLKGVSVVLVADLRAGDSVPLQPVIMVTDRFQRPPDRENRGADDRGSNYLAIAFAKLAEMYRTWSASGSSPDGIRNGELGYQGGLVAIESNLIYLVAFSGGTPEQDLEIAREGMSAVLPSQNFTG